MPYTKTWIGTTSTDYSVATNWKAHSIRNAAYKWTPSGSGTSEYYLELAAGGNPGIPQPGAIEANLLNLTSGSAGSLAASRWAWADNDTLGYSTVYIRLADSTDPDTKPTDFVGFKTIPQAGDSVVLNEEATKDIALGLDQGAVSLAGFIATPGFSKKVGTSLLDLRIVCTSFEWAGSGQGYVDLTTSAISPVVKSTTTPGNGQGLYLKGSALVTVSVEGGSVGVAARPGETATVTTVRALGPNSVVLCGVGASITNGETLQGTLTFRCGATTLRCHGGTLTTLGTGVVTTVHVFAGTCVLSSSGTITTVNCNGGITDFIQSGVSRTVTTLKQNPGATVAYDPNVLTITTRSAPDSPTRFIAATAA